MAPGKLLGPPEIYLPAAAAAGDTTVDKNAFSTQPTPPIGLTENGSATFMASGNPCVDFFFHIVPDTPAESLINRLELAWNHNPVITLKLICNLRGVRGTGKSDKKGFYTAALWLHNHHPKTLACNVKAIADFGYFKDMLEILYRLLEGPDIRENQKSVYIKKSEYDQSSSKRKRVNSEEAKAGRLEKRVAKAKKGFERYNRDPHYRFLHDCVSDFFSELLKADIELYKNNQLYKISLASKWCPSLDSSYDTATLMCESIARKVFPKDEYVEYQEIDDKYYAYLVRDRLRKEVLVPLHKALQLPEVYICANKWNELPYKHVASVAMKLYKRLFYKHDQERFKEYLEKVKSGKAKIAAGALLPHEIINSLNDPDGGEVAELQWKRMVDDLAKKGKLTNCMAICDVSGSMNGTPMEVSVALGLLISELSEDPWKGQLITFSANPQLHKIQGYDLRSKTEFIKRMEWGANTDFQKVFDRILEVAVQCNLTEEQMIQRVFVFSDMEFDQACASYSYGYYGGYNPYGYYGGGNPYGYETGTASSGKWETDYEVIKRKFQEKGYQKVPEIVFWNLRNSKATPVPSNQPGVALVSGFSKNLVTLFLDAGGIINPEAVMLQAISGEEYQSLLVFD